MAERARAMGEARFEGAESVDERMNPPSVLGSAESADGVMNPLQLERNQLTEPLESTDGKMYPARVELMETAEQFVDSRGVRPLVITELDAVEDHSKQTSKCSEATITVVPVERASTRAVVCPNFNPDDPIIIIEDANQNFSVMDPDTAEEPRCFEQDDREATAATTVAGAEQKIQTGQRYNQISSSHKEPVISTTGESSRVCSHFGEAVEPTVDPDLHDEVQIRDESGMLLIGPVATVCDLDDCVEASGESSASGTSMESTVGKEDVNSCGGVSEESSDEKPPMNLAKGSSMNLAVRREDKKCEEYEKSKIGLSHGSTAVGDRDEVSQRSVTSQPLSLSELFSEIQKNSETEAEIETRSEARLDHPASDYKDYEESKIQVEKSKKFGKKEGKDYEESGSTATGSTVNTSDIGNISITTMDYEESRDGSTRSAPAVTDVSDVRNVGNDYGKSDKDEEILYRQIRTAPAGNKWSSERQRPTRFTRRPPRFRDKEFEMQFRPEEKRKRCNRLGRGDQARKDVDNFCNFHQFSKKKRYKSSGRGVQKKNVRTICSKTEQQSASPSRRKVTTQKLSAHRDRASDTCRNGELQCGGTSSSKPLLDVIQLAGAQESCESLTSKRTDMKERSEVIAPPTQDGETYRNRRRYATMTITSTESSVLRDITSAKPVQHGESNRSRKKTKQLTIAAASAKNGQRSRTDRSLTEWEKV